MATSIWGILLKIVSRINSRSLVLLLFAVLALMVVSGCGDKKEGSTDTAAETSNSDDGGTVKVVGPTDTKTMTEAQTKAEEKKNFSEEPPPIQILVGNTTGYYVDKPTIVIAKSKSELRVIQKKHFTHGVKKQELAPIEFPTRQIDALFLPQGKKGSLVTITDVHQEGDTIVVTAIRLLPGDGCSVSGPKPRPFHW